MAGSFHELAPAGAHEGSIFLEEFVVDTVRQQMTEEGEFKGGGLCLT